MILPAAMSLEVHQASPDGKVNGMQIASMQAQGIADAFPQYARSSGT